MPVHQAVLCPFFSDIGTANRVFGMRQTHWHRGAMRWRLFVALALLCTSAARGASIAPDISELSLEELLEVDVRLVLRKGETVRSSPSAVYVLDSDAIRRSGATSIPELLRLVPGVEVARFGSGKWAITIRGFNGIFTNRLLILVDGRSVFSQAKVGMFWDTLDSLIEDIERIEVVRGPGAALWGGNAFNGVINIVTRHASDTVGGLATIGAGNEDNWFTGLRYGARAGATGFVRGYIKAFERDDGSRLEGGENKDGWHALQGGLRYDRGDDDSGALTVILDAYQGEEGEAILLDDVNSPTFNVVAEPTIPYSGASALARWSWRSSAHSRWSLQAYVDHSEREDAFLDIKIDAYDLDFQHDWTLSARQRLIWGLGYRYIEDELPTQYLSFDPVRRNYDVASGFAQYEFSPRPDKLRLIAGAKAEHNDFTGTELQPNARAIWTPGADTSVWAAVSRAQRTPSRTEHDVTAFSNITDLGGGVLLQLRIEGNRRFDSERLTAYEAGWRRRFSPALALDLALFYNDYSGLRTLEPMGMEFNPSPPPHVIVPIAADNGADARSWGGELVLRARPIPRWQLELAYNHLQLRVNDGGSADTTAKDSEDNSPRHRLTLRSLWQLPRDAELNATLRYVDEISSEAGIPPVDAYTELDLVLLTRIGQRLQLSLVGQNLLDRNHQEYDDIIVGTPAVEVERAYYLKLRLDF